MGWRHPGAVGRERLQCAKRPCKWLISAVACSLRSSRQRMDIPRIGEAKRRRRKRMLMAAMGLIALAGITMGLMRLPPASPSVPRSTLYFGTVKEGEVLREVRGNG